MLTETASLGESATFINSEIVVTKTTVSTKTNGRKYEEFHRYATSNLEFESSISTEHAHNQTIKSGRTSKTIRSGQVEKRAKTR